MKLDALVFIDGYFNSFLSTVTKVCPSLFLMLARGVKAPVAKSLYFNKYKYLCNKVGLVYEAGDPIAAITALADGAARSADYWLRVDPVHMAVGRDGLSLTHGCALNISSEEAKILTTSINEHFREQGVVINPLNACRWYYRSEESLDLKMYAPQQVSNLDKCLIAGRDGSTWQRIINEMQMLLYAHPLNQVREDHGEPPINGAWPWGGGRLPGLEQRTYDEICAPAIFAKGLARAIDAQYAASIKHLNSMRDNALPNRNVLAMIDMTCDSDQAASHEDRFRSLEEDWCAPLLQSLKDEAVELLTVEVSSLDKIYAVSITKSDLWKVWRQIAKLR